MYERRRCNECNMKTKRREVEGNLEKLKLLGIRKTDCFQLTRHTDYFCF